MNKTIIAMLMILAVLPTAFALITDVEAVNVTANSSIIKWKTNQSLPSAVLYSVDKEIFGEKIIAANVVEHVFTLDGLLSNTTYYYYVKSGNQTDNNSGLYYNFTTLAAEPVYIETGVPSITVSAPSLSNTNEVTITGTTQPNVQIRFFINDRKLPEQILETGRYSAGSSPDGSFSATIQLSRGIYEGEKGLNIVKVEGTTAAFERNSVVHTIRIDEDAPTLLLTEIKGKVNTANPVIKGSVDEPCTIDFILNGQPAAKISAEDVFEQAISLPQGVSELEIIAVDKAGNKAEYNQTIEIDTTAPKINIPKLDDIYHFTILTIEGNTSEPNVEVSVVNTGGQAFRINYSVITDDEFWRPIERNISTQVGFDPTGAIVGYRKTAESDEKGRFELKVTLLNGTNNLVFFARDEAGNTATETKRVRMEQSSGLWKIGRITTVPNEVYSDNFQKFDVDIGVMYEVHYLGGNIEEIKDLKVDTRKDGDKLDNNLIAQPERPVYAIDKEENSIFVYEKIRIKKYTGNLDEYPQQVRFAMEVRIDYEIQDIDYDEKTFYESSVAVEKPIDYSKWLTPELINASLEKLEKAEKIMENLVRIAEYADLISLGACIIHAGTKVATGDVEGASLRNLYIICDRAMCPYIGPDCSDREFEPGEETYRLTFEGGEAVINWIGSERPDDCPRGPEGTNYFTMDIIQQTGFPTGTELGTEQPIIHLPKGYEIVEATRCGRTNKTLAEFNPTIAGCYAPGPDQYDETKCLFNMFTKTATFTNTNPYEGLFSSTACGCVPGIRGNLENWLKIVRGSKKCLQQAQIGEVRGGYCERLIAQFTCDFITAALKQIPKLSKFFIEIAQKGGERSGLGQIRENYGEVRDSLQMRYGNIAKNRFGLNSEDIAEKACLLAITGDWSELQNLFRKSVRAPVKPVVGPMLPESRVTAYNPFTGEISINYLLTLGIMSGGQVVRGKVELFCHPGYENGQFCPPDVVEKIATRTIVIQEDGSLSENWAYDDSESKYWANVAIMTLEYDLGGQKQTVTKIEPVVRKGGMIVQCNFELVPPGIVCESIMPATRIPITMEKAYKSPNVKYYYPENQLAVKVEAEKVGASVNQTKQLEDIALMYELIIPASNGGLKKEITNENDLEEYKVFGPLQKKVKGNFYVPLLIFPEEIRLSATEQQQYVRSEDIEQTEEQEKFKKDDKITLKAFGDDKEINIAEVDAEDIEKEKWDYTGNTAVYTVTEDELELEIDEIRMAYISDETRYRLELNDKELVSEFKTVKREIQSSVYVESKNYKLTLWLVNDKNGDNQYDEEDDAILVDSRGKNQTEVLKFGFEADTKGKKSPLVDIINPVENAIVCDEDDNELKMELSYWDDKNEIDAVAVKVRNKDTKKDFTLYNKSNRKADELEKYTGTIDILAALEEKKTSFTELGYRKGDKIKFEVIVYDGNIDSKTGDEEIEYVYTCISRPQLED